jgi:acyl-CoA synthetase (AMP-forming)/AMP-acid ligase II
MCPITPTDNPLLERFRSLGDRPAFVWRDQEFTYADLCADVGYWSDRLDREDVSWAACVALVGDFSPSLCALLIALVGRHSVAVPLAATLHPDVLAESIEIAGVDAVVDFDEFDRACVRHVERTDSHPLFDELRGRGEAGLVIFTSGTTGQRKGALLSIERLLERFRPDGRAFRGLAFLLLDHIGGINTLFTILCAGGTVVTVEERSTAAVCRAVEKYRVQLLPVTPTFLKMLLISEDHRRHDLSWVEVISYGAEPMPTALQAVLEQVFPRVSFRQLYGATELGILPTRTNPANPLLLQVTGADVETRVVNGTLWVRAPTRMLGYLNTATAVGLDGWYDTQDAVEVHGEYLRILGRVSDVINVGGEKVHPAEVEDVLHGLDNVADVVVYARPNPVTGQVVAARLTLIRPEDRLALYLRVRAFCRDKLAPHQVPMTIEVVDGGLHGDRFKKVRRLPVHRSA